MNRFVRTLNALLALTLMGILIAAYYQQFFKGNLICPLCYLQRLGLIGIAVGGMMNLRFGIRNQHYALSLLSLFFGGGVAIRHICLHICPGMYLFGHPVMGLGLYTWSFIVYACSFFAIIVLLFLPTKDEAPVKMNGFEKFVFCVVVLMTLANCATTFYECGFGPCKNVPWPQPVAVR